MGCSTFGPRPVNISACDDLSFILVAKNTFWIDWIARHIFTALKNTENSILTETVHALSISQAYLRVMPAIHAQETCTRNLHEKFDASSSTILASKQLSSQSRCTVCVTCRTDVPKQSCARNLYQKTCTRLTDTFMCMFLVQDDLQAYVYQFLDHVSKFSIRAEWPELNDTMHFTF